MLSRVFWTFFLFAHVRCQLGVVSSVSSGYVQPAVQKPIVQRPVIPILYYYSSHKQDKYIESLAHLKDGYIGFTEDTGRDSFDIPKAFYYRIKCGSTPIAKPWITDDRIQQSIQLTTCYELLKNQQAIRFQADGLASVDSRRLFPIPLTQDYNGKNIQAKEQGISINHLSTCCFQKDCPSQCLQSSEPQTCHLEIFTASSDNQADDLAYSPVISSSGPTWQRRFRVPCTYCALASCIRNCSNGEMATDFATFVVGLVFSMVSSVVRDPFVSCRKGHRSQIYNASHAPPGPGTPARTRPPASGISRRTRTTWCWARTSSSSPAGQVMRLLLTCFASLFTQASFCSGELLPMPVCEQVLGV